MKAEQEVSFVDKNGDRMTGIVEAIVGAGDSDYKIIDLRYGPKDKPTRVESVRHGRDAMPGEAYWLLKSEKRPHHLDTIVEASEKLADRKKK